LRTENLNRLRRSVNTLEC